MGIKLKFLGQRKNLKGPMVDPVDHKILWMPQEIKEVDDGHFGLLMKECGDIFEKVVEEKMAKPVEKTKFMEGLGNSK